MGMECMVSAIKAADVERILADPDNIEQLITPDGRSGSFVSLEKAWHGLHFLLTGSAMEGEMPLGFLLQGGEEVGDDMGYGPARLLRADEVSQLNSALAALTDAQLWRNFDADRMSEEGVYPDCWDEDENDLREEYLHYFHELKKVVQKAQSDRGGLLVMLG